MGRIDISEVLAVAVVVGLLASAASALIRIAARERGRRSVIGPALLDGAIVASVAGVLAATLTPVDLLGSRLDHPSEVNLRPLEAMRGAPRVYAVINTVLIVPTIVLLAQRWRRAGIIRLTLAGVAFSVAVEVAQLVHPLRGTNVDDVALNGAGAAVAAVIGVTIRMLARRRPRADGADRSAGIAVHDERRPTVRTR